MDAILELKVLADVGLVGFQMLENQLIVCSDIS
jgi:GTPase involved in cell partitioning and DNA repair